MQKSKVRKIPRETIYKNTHQAANDDDANLKENWKIPSELITQIDVCH